MKIYVGHDSREDIAYQVCEHSIKRRDPNAEVYPLKQKCGFTTCNKCIFFFKTISRYQKKRN